MSEAREDAVKSAAFLAEKIADLKAQLKKAEQAQHDALATIRELYEGEVGTIDTYGHYKIVAVRPVVAAARANQMYLNQVGPVLEDRGLAKRQERWVGLNKDAIAGAATELAEFGVDVSQLYPAGVQPDMEVRIVKR